jgi:hypothetical protein
MPNGVSGDWPGRPSRCDTGASSVPPAPSWTFCMISALLLIMPFPTPPMTGPDLITELSHTRRRLNPTSSLPGFVSVVPSPKRRHGSSVMRKGVDLSSTPPQRPAVCLVITNSARERPRHLVIRLISQLISCLAAPGAPPLLRKSSQLDHVATVSFPPRPRNPRLLQPD